MLWVHLVTSALGAACWRRAACADVLAQQVMGLPFMPTHPCHAHDARARQASAARRSRRRAARRAPRPRGMHRRARSPRPRCSARCSTAAPRSCWPWRTGCGPRRAAVGHFRLCAGVWERACCASGAGSWALMTLEACCVLCVRSRSGRAASATGPWSAHAIPSARTRISGARRARRAGGWSSWRACLPGPRCCCGRRCTAAAPTRRRARPWPARARGACGGSCGAMLR